MMTVIVDLLASASATPHFERAACRGSVDWDLDATATQRARAAEICLTECAELDRCRHWLAGLEPDARPGGTIAGKFLQPPPAPDLEQAIDWLLCHLAGRGPTPSAWVKADALAAGITKHPLHAARTALDVLVEGSGKQTYWTLPARKDRP